MEFTKVIFLDIDGVLNSNNIFKRMIIKFFYYLKKEEWLRKHIHLYGISLHKMKLLKRIVKTTGAKIVICSRLRNDIIKIPFSELTGLSKQFVMYSNLLELSICEVTPSIDNMAREDEINTWLLDYNKCKISTANNKSDNIYFKETNNVYSIFRFVILDDEDYHYPHLKEKHLIKTSNLENNQCAVYPTKCGLKMKHVKEAIRILNA